MSDNQLTAPIPCRTCGGKNDCQIEAQYPNGDGRGYFVDCPDCDGTGLDTSYEACPYCDKSLSLDVHDQCAEQFRSAITSVRTLETIAKAALDAAGYDSLDDPWCTDEDYCEGPVAWDTATDTWRQNGYRIAAAVLGAIEASGRVTVDRARFERLLKPMQLYVHAEGIVVDFTGKGAIAFGKAFEDAVNEIRANPGDLDPLP